MDGLIFLFLAFLTIFFSIKLSYYGDLLSKQSSFGSLFIGGLLIASITSLPEFVTSISASILNNSSLSLGDILGSNFFNVFVLAIYNIYFFKKCVFKNTSKKYIFETIILIIDYFFIFLGSNNILTFLTSFVLIINYLFYIISLFNNSSEDERSTTDEKHVILKFFITAVFMIIVSIFLTVEADKITRLYPSFSSSTIGAILLGITTSLPEVVTTFSLLQINNYNMAISNMLGSNIFNFLILSISDFFYKGEYIYYPIDKNSSIYIFGGLISLVLFLITLLFKNKSNLFYIFFSVIICFLYLYIWYLQFI